MMVRSIENVSRKMPVFGLRSKLSHLRTCTSQQKKCHLVSNRLISVRPNRKIDELKIGDSIRYLPLFSEGMGNSYIWLEIFFSFQYEWNSEYLRVSFDFQFFETSKLSPSIPRIPARQTSQIKAPSSYSLILSSLDTYLTRYTTRPGRLTSIAQLNLPRANQIYHCQ